MSKPSSKNQKKAAASGNEAKQTKKGKSKEQKSFALDGSTDWFNFELTDDDLSQLRSELCSFWWEFSKDFVPWWGMQTYEEKKAFLERSFPQLPQKLVLPEKVKTTGNVAPELNVELLLYGQCTCDNDTSKPIHNGIGDHNGDRLLHEFVQRGSVAGIDYKQDDYYFVRSLKNVSRVLPRLPGLEEGNYIILDQKGNMFRFTDKANAEDRITILRHIEDGTLLDAECDHFRKIRQYIILKFLLALATQFKKVELPKAIAQLEAAARAAASQPATAATENNTAAAPANGTIDTNEKANGTTHVADGTTTDSNANTSTNTNPSKPSEGQGEGQGEGEGEVDAEAAKAAQQLKDKASAVQERFILAYGYALRIPRRKKKSKGKGKNAADQQQQQQQPSDGASGANDLGYVSERTKNPKLLESQDPITLQLFKAEDLFLKGLHQAQAVDASNVMETVKLFNEAFLLDDRAFVLLPYVARVATLALEHHKEDVQTKLFTAIINIATDNLHECSLMLTDLMQLLPEQRAQLLHLRGNCYIGLGQFKDTIDDYTAALEADPSFYLLYYKRGTLFSSMGVIERAFEDYQKFVEAAHVDCPYLSQSCFALCMLTMRLSKGTDVAQRYFEKAKAAEKRAEELYGKSKQTTELQKMAEALFATGADGASLVQTASRLFESAMKQKGGQFDLMRQLYMQGLSPGAPGSLNTANGLCAHCGAATNKQTGETLKQCGRCNGVLYCSRACQTAHWAIHKTECKLLKTLADMVGESLKLQ